MEAIIFGAMYAMNLQVKDDDEFVDGIVREGLAGKHIFFEHAYKSS